jgi:acyl-CoA synthetase (AMP-forming)/AMP-acid ligase II
MAMQADMSWCMVLAHHATRAPDRAITVFEGEATTYAEMASRVAALAGGLSAQGVGPGDVVALLSYNCPEFLETVFAANHVGASAMPINWRLAAPEVRYILEHSGARALVCDEALVALAPRSSGPASRRQRRPGGSPSPTCARPQPGPRSRRWRPRPTTCTA